jgi:uncharacterized protein involved in outer membrane biogenesis
MTHAMSAPTWMKNRWAKVLAGVVLALVVLALVLPYFLNVDRYRGAISDLISMQTGRKVTLGPLSATILPRLGFSVDGFQMANPPDFAQGDFVSAQEIRGTVEFWPLVLRRELRVTSLELIQARVTLLEDDRGRDNYTFSSRPAPAAATPAAEADGGAAREAGGVALRMDRVTLSDAGVFYGTVDRRGRTSATLDVTGLDAELRQLALQPLRVREWQGEANLSGMRLTLAGWNAPVLFDSGDVILAEGKLDSSFTAQFGRAARIQGTVTVPDVESAVPQFDVKTEDLDLEALLAGLTAEPSTAGRGGGAAPAAGAPASARPAAAAGPSRLVIQGHLAAERIRRAPYTTGPLTADLRVFTDRTEIWPVILRFAGGAIQLTARTDRRQVPQRFSANVQVRDLNTGEILGQSPELRGKFAGTGELDLQLVGSLGPQWTRTLTGTGQFAIRNGRITGFNLTGAAQSLARLTGVSGDTPFTRLGGDLSIRNERISSQQIHLDSPRGTLDLRGSCGFDGSLDYQGQMIAQLGGAAPQASGGGARDIISGIIGGAISSRVGQGQATVPFVLRGTLQQPQLRPGSTLPQFARPTQPSQPAQPTQPSQPQGGQGFTFPNIFQR